MAPAIRPERDPIEFGLQDWMDILRNAALVREGEPDFEESRLVVRAAMTQIENLTREANEAETELARDIGPLGAGALAAAHAMGLGIGGLLSPESREVLRVSRKKHPVATKVGVGASIAGTALPGLATSAPTIGSALARNLPTAFRAAAQALGPGARAAVAEAAATQVPGIAARGAQLGATTLQKVGGVAAGGVIPGVEGAVGGFAEEAGSLGERLAQAGQQGATGFALGALTAGRAQRSLRKAKKGVAHEQQLASRTAEMAARAPLAERRLQKLMGELPPTTEDSIRKALVRAGVSPGPILERAVQDELTRRGITTF